VFHRHGLSIASGALLALWIALYSVSSEKTHLGSFFGNAIADWTGSVVMILGTKYLYERGSAESRQPKDKPPNPVLCWLVEHSLSIFLLITVIALVTAFVLIASESKWGQVVGNIVSEWTQ